MEETKRETKYNIIALNVEPLPQRERIKPEKQRCQQQKQRNDVTGAVQVLELSKKNVYIPQVSNYLKRKDEQQILDQFQSKPQTDTDEISNPTKLNFSALSFEEKRAAREKRFKT